MAAQLDEKITTYFLGNSDSLTKEAEKAKKSVEKLQKTLTERVSGVKGSILDPGAMVGTGLQKALGGVASKLKLGSGGSSVLTGVAGSLGAAGAVLVKTFTAANNLAGMNADKMAGVSESMRQMSRVNMFASSVDGLDSLKDKYASTQSLIKEAKQTQREVDPYGFGGGVKGNMLTVVGNAQSSLKSAVGLGEYNNFDREKDEAATLELRQRIAQQEQNKLARQFGVEQCNQVGLTRERLMGSSSEAKQTELDRQRQAELNGLKGTALNSDANQNAINQRYAMQIGAERENSYFTGRRNARDRGLAGIEGSAISDQQKRVGVAGSNLSAIREELSGRKYLTKEARELLQVDELRAQNELRAASLANRQHEDGLTALKLSIQSEREVVALGRQDLAAKAQLADLDVKAAQAAVDQAHGSEQYAAAEAKLVRAVAARAAIEKETAALNARKQRDEINASALSIANQRELVTIGQRGFEAKKQMADLDVQAAQAAVAQAKGTADYAAAQKRLQKAVAARVNLEKISVATQRASADLSFALANRMADVNGTNSSSLVKRAQSNQLNMAAMGAEYSLPGTTDERKRQLYLGIRGAENERREMLQERGFGKSESQIQRELRREAKDKRLRDRFDAKYAATNGLMGVHRDMSGRIISGTDMLTGQVRASMGHLTKPDTRGAGANTLMQVQTRQLAAQEAMKAGIDKLNQTITSLPEMFALR